MKLNKPRILLVTEQSLLGECLVTALRQYSVCLKENIGKVMQMDFNAHPPFEVAVIHVDSQNALTPTETREVSERLGDTRLIVFGKSKEESEVVSYLEAGAFDYLVTESESVQGFCQAIDDAIIGEISYGPERTKAIFDRLQRLAAEVKRIREIDTSHLTPRELEILNFIEAGKTNAEIAEGLFLSLHTVKNHVHNMLSKLNCRNRREAVHVAYSNGWIKFNSSV